MSTRLTLASLASHLRRAAFVGVLAPIALGAQGALAKSDATLAVEAVSNRADLVAGGDVLVRVTLPPGLARNNKAVLSLNGQPLSDPMHPAPDGHGYLALVTGLHVGQNSLTLAVPGRSVQLAVNNHPIGGPVFSGPHLQPWTCTTQNHGLGAALDADCNAAPQYAFFYKRRGHGDLPCI